MSARLIKIVYDGERVTSACTLEGALRAALIRGYHNEYSHIFIYDCRFGDLELHDKTLAVKVVVKPRSMSVEWKTPKT